MTIYVVINLQDMPVKAFLHWEDAQEYVKSFTGFYFYRLTVEE